MDSFNNLSHSNGWQTSHSIFKNCQSEYTQNNSTIKLHFGQIRLQINFVGVLKVLVSNCSQPLLCELINGI